MSQNLRIFCPLLGTVHYWELLLNKNGWEAGFCPLLGAFPLLGSALLGEYSVFALYEDHVKNEVYKVAIADIPAAAPAGSPVAVAQITSSRASARSFSISPCCRAVAVH